MQDFRQSKTFKPLRQIAPVPVFKGGEITTELQHFYWRTGYMSQRYKAELFGTANASLEAGNTAAAEKLSVLANYLASLSVDNLSWMVGSHLHQDAPEIQAAMERMAVAGGVPYDPIHQVAAIRYARFGRSSLTLVRVPTIEDFTTPDGQDLPISVKVKSSPGPEMLLGFSETSITINYPLPAGYGQA